MGPAVSHHHHAHADFQQSMHARFTCRLQTVNARTFVLVQTSNRQCTTRVANCCTQTSNRQMHGPARGVLTSHACGTAASWASCQSLGGRVGKRPVLEARRVQKVCTQANLLTPWRELAWNCWACASQSRLMSTAPFYGPVSPAYSGRKNVYFFRTREVLLLGPFFAVGFYCGDVWIEICWARLFSLSPCSLTSPPAVMYGSRSARPDFSV